MKQGFSGLDDATMAQTVEDWVVQDRVVIRDPQGLGDI